MGLFSPITIIYNCLMNASVKVINSSRASLALKAAIKQFEGRKVDLRRRSFVIVPDHITLAAERLLCSLLGGAMDIEITTLNKLFRNYLGNKTANLNKNGSIMLLKRIIEENSSSLKCYSKSASSRGFASRIYETISLIESALISPGDLMSSAANKKDEDIALIYSKYKEFIDKEMPDASGRMRLLAEYIDSSSTFKGASVTFACFDEITLETERIIDAFAKKATSVSVYSYGIEDYSLNELVIYESISDITSVKSIASKIAYLLKSGASADEIAVLTADSNPYELRRVFKENDIPFTASEPLALSRHPLGAFLTLALISPLRGYRPKDVILLAKNPFAGLNAEDVMSFERYVLKYGVSYKGFFDPFEQNDTKYLEGAERVRASLKNILDAHSDNTIERFKMLIKWAEEVNAKSVSEENLGRANPFERAKEICAEAELLLSQADRKVAADAIIDAIASCELGRRPTYKNAVEIGSESDLIAREFKYIFVPDFSGDNHPQVIKDEGLLSDEDIDRLKSAFGDKLCTTIETNKRKKSELLGLLSSASYVFLYYSEAPGRVLGELKSIARRVTERSVTGEREDMLSGGGKGLMKISPTLNMLAEFALVESGKGEDNVAEKVVDYAYSKSSELIPEKEIEKNEVAEAGKLMEKAAYSVSQLERYFTCPRQYFFSVGLSARKPEEADVNALDIGRIVHYAAEKFILAMDVLSPEEAAKQFVKEALKNENKTLSGLSQQMLESEVSELLKEIVLQRDISDYKPMGAELGFGMIGSKLKEIKIGNISLHGFIDRVDVSSDGKGARVFDYKTGKKDLSESDIIKGTKIQLPLYLLALKQNGYSPEGAFYMPTIKTANGYEISGIVERSDEVKEKTNLNGEYIKESEFNKKARKGIIGYDSLDEIMDYTEQLAVKAIEEIGGGYIAASPLNYQMCLHCDFRSCCAYSGEFREKN